MEEKNYTFNSFSEYAQKGICQALTNFNIKNKKPIIICVGSDLVLGDSLGPLVGTFLRKKNVRSYIYGTLNFPITAKEVEYARTYLKQMHPNSISIAIDAAVGSQEDVGLIRVLNRGIKPGLGVDKNLGVVGDISIVGIVASKSLQNTHLFNLTRLNLVFKMAECIANGVEEYIAHFVSDNNIVKNNIYGA